MNTQTNVKITDNQKFEMVLHQIGFYKKVKKTDKQGKELARALYQLGYFKK